MRTSKPQDARRIDTLIERMSLTEKLGQLTMMSASHSMTGPVLASGLKPGDRLGLTIEPAGGSPHPTSAMILMLAL